MPFVVCGFWESAAPDIFVFVVVIGWEGGMERAAVFGFALVFFVLGLVLRVRGWVAADGGIAISL